MSNSNTYEIWEKLEPQASLKKAIENHSGNAKNRLADQMNTFDLLKDNKDAIASMANTLGVDIVDNTLVSAADVANGDRGKFATSVMQILHLISKHRAPVQPSTDGNMTFQIRANGDVVAMGKDNNGKDVVLATAYAHANINKEHFSYCDDSNRVDGAQKNACIENMKFIAGVYNGKYNDANAGLLTAFMGYNTELNTPNNKESKVINSFAILRRIGWRAKSDDSAVYTLADFSMDELKDATLRKTLNHMFNVRVADDDAWNAFTPDTWSAKVQEANLNDFGKLVKECIETVNKEPQILRAQIGHQRFSQNNNSGRVVRGRLEALKIRPSYLDSISAHMRNQSSRVPTIILSGGANSADATNALRHALDAAMANLERHGKRLSSDTYRKFMNKLDALAAAETDINDFLEHLNNYGNSDAAKAPGHSVTYDDIKNFQEKSKKAAETTWTLQTGIANINLKLTGPSLSGNPEPKAPSGYNL